eukprot:CAMPEP_0114240828 /NCGR_PEP_ID=MMETSP0058-20121206/9311_1 /TAXON_ID=36894 /ORGANISM="Pyramimonas parkeae, CCMP726" /LENGTH=130 /DNA_ID=CAMNT_0001353321 /DNA_START=163 /DNA_END=552 /DNA_ORIENTATION=+
MEGKPFQMPENILYTSDPDELQDFVLTYFTPNHGEGEGNQHPAEFSALGFDIEWKPNTVKLMDNPTAVVQISSEHAACVAQVIQFKADNRLHMKRTKGSLHMDFHRSGNPLDGDGEILYPWITRRVFRSD